MQSNKEGVISRLWYPQPLELEYAGDHVLALFENVYQIQGRPFKLSNVRLSTEVTQTTP